MKNISELKELWDQEKEYYKKSEVGSGVQTFVWEVFQCHELFNLSKGLKSTEKHKRKGEFLLEESSKNGQADAVIFIDSEVVIPVEVEKYEKAQSGEWQVLKYRTAFDKKYGILTDGNEWRFYYGEIEDEKYYKFTIDELFADPKRFCTFWDEYIKPQNYYLSFFEEIGQQKMKLFDPRLSVDEHRGRFFEDVTDIIRKLKDKLLNAGFLHNYKSETEFNKTATEIAYSYLIQFILYKTLVDNAFDDFETEFTKKSNSIHQNLKKESYNSVLMILEGMSEKISENIYKPFHKEQATIFEQIKNILHSGEENLMNVAPFLDIFFFIRKYHFGDVQNDIFGAIYENYLKELYEDQNLGQYFTDPSVVNFMLEEIGYNAEEIKKRNHGNISIIDPSCGSGTFLYSAVREIVKARDYSNEEESKKLEKEILDNIFGLDIAGFPLYLAEMSILMKILPIIVAKKYNNPIDKKLKLFVTEDSISEFIGEVGGRSEAGDDAPKLALEWKYEGFMRDERDLDEMKDSLKTVGGGTKTISRRRFDFVIGNPPYIGYNECSNQKVKIVKMIQNKNLGVEMSDIYGWNLNTVPGRTKAYAPKPNLYAFFLALGFALLKENGRFCYVIPQTLLTAGDLDVLRYKLSKDYTIEKILTFAGNLFVGRGTNQKKKISTSSLILVCTKSKAPKDHYVECVHLSNADIDINNVFPTLKKHRAELTKSISQKQLYENLENWNFVKWDLSLISLYNKYKSLEKFDIYRLPEISQKQFSSIFYFDKGLVFPKDKIIDGNKGDYLLIKNSPYYNVQLKDKSLLTKDIRLPKGAQGLKVFQKKYKVVWSYMNPNGFKFSSENIMLDFNWILISSDNKQEMMYIFALLNSKINWCILNSLLKIQNEKSFSIGIKTIKEFIRIPRITSKNQSLKDKVIKFVEQMLEIEKQTIGNIVDFDTLLQHFDDVQVKGIELVLKSGLKEIRRKIKNGASRLVKKALDNHFESMALVSNERSISLTDLNSLSVFDLEEQRRIKEKIDNLVFELYGLTEKERKIVVEQQ